MPTGFGQTAFYHDDHATQREFERVFMFLGTTEQVLNALVPGGGGISSLIPGMGENSEIDITSDEIKMGIWALTTEHNGQIITARVVQDLDFRDTGKKHPKYEMGLIWKLTEASLRSDLATISTAKKTAIEALVYTSPKQFFEWFDYCLQPLMSIRGVPNGNEGYWNYGIKLVNDENIPGANKYYGTNNSGTKGYHSIPPRQRVIKVPFGYNNKTPSSSTYIPAGNIVNRVEVDIATAFDAAATFTISANSITIMNENFINFAREGLYLNQWHYDIAAQSQVSLSLTTTATAGQGTAYIWFIEAES